MDHPKKRDHPRFAHEASVTLTAQDGRSIEGHTSNVSRGGMCADMDEALMDGTDVEADITLIFDEETQSEPLRLSGRVVWCTSVDSGYQIGVSFKPLDDETFEYLTMFLRYLDDGEPVLRIPRESTLDKRFG